MKTAKICRQVWRIAAMMALLCTGGCVMVIPHAADKPRFTTEQLSTLQPGTSTRESVYAVLGQPSVPPFHASMGPFGTPSDFVRRNGELVVYTWNERSAGRIMFQDGQPEPLSEDKLALFLRFNEEGLLISQQLVNQHFRALSDRAQPLCDADGVCVEVFWSKALSLNFGALTVPGTEHLPEPANNLCSVVLWLSQIDWSKHGIGLDYSLLPGPLAQRYTTWFPVGSFVELNMPPGARTIQFSNPNIRRSVNTRAFPFDCAAGQRTWIEVGVEPHLAELGIVLRPIDAQAGAEHVKGLRQLLLRDE